MRFITPLFVTFFLLVLPLPLLAQPLIESQQLITLLNNEQTQPIDIRNIEAYDQGHIPGAVSAPYALWRGPANNPGQLANPQEFEALIQELGFTPEQHLVVYSSGADETDFGAAARVYWTLKYLGFAQISVLNGGYRYWEQQASHPVAEQATQLTPSTTQIELRPELAIQQDELLSKLQQPQHNFQLFDARPPAFYNGATKAPTASTAGTIAGAQNVPFQQWFIPGQTRVRSAVEIKQLVAQQGLDQAPETLSFCNTGHWAATNWFVLSELAELQNVRLYPASLAEWTQSPEALPMENTPSRLEQIKAKFKALVN